MSLSGIDRLVFTFNSIANYNPVTKPYYKAINDFAFSNLVKLIFYTFPFFLSKVIQVTGVIYIKVA